MCMPIIMAKFVTNIISLRSSYHCELWCSITCIFQMGRQKLKEVKKYATCHWASTWWTWSLNPIFLLAAEQRAPYHYDWCLWMSIWKEKTHSVSLSSYGDSFLLLCEQWWPMWAVDMLKQWCVISKLDHKRLCTLWDHSLRESKPSCNENVQEVLWRGPCDKVLVLQPTTQGCYPCVWVSQPGSKFPNPGQAFR